MIKISNIEVFGWQAAIRGMRNPLESWEKSDSTRGIGKDPEPINPNDFLEFQMGANDHDLAMRLAKAGSVHAKYRRMIVVQCNVLAPLYWWKEFDTYKVGTVSNSCSTMHKIHANEFTLDDFSHEHLYSNPVLCNIESTIALLNKWRTLFNYTDKEREDYFHLNGHPFVLSKKDCWWQMIQLLPTSYNQLRTVQLNYEALSGMYRDRRSHKLDEWRDFCGMIECLPYSELITIGGE